MLTVALEHSSMVPKMFNPFRSFFVFGGFFFFLFFFFRVYGRAYPLF